MFVSQSPAADPSLRVHLVFARHHFVLSISRASRSSGHVNKRHTSALKVPFYVGDRFNEEFSGSNLKQVEKSVEEDYISNLRNNCWKEKQQSELTRRALSE